MSVTGNEKIVLHPDLLRGLGIDIKGSLLYGNAGLDIGGIKRGYSILSETSPDPKTQQWAKEKLAIIEEYFARMEGKKVPYELFSPKQ